MMVLHVVAAVCALVSGMVALFAPKGGWLHRKSGIVFVYSMLAMSASGAVMGALQPNIGNVMGGVVTFYLVLTGWRAVRRPVLEFQTIDAVATLGGLAVGLAALTLGFEASASAAGGRGGVPAPVYFMFATMALLATLGDIRVMRAGRIQGTRRLARHLWRMCFALFIATASFFLGPPRRLPAPLRHSPLLPIPVLLVLVVMAYWLVRVSFRPPRLAANRSFDPTLTRTA